MANDHDNQGGFAIRNLLSDAKAAAPAPQPAHEPSSHWFGGGSLSGATLTSDISQTANQTDAKAAAPDKAWYSRLYDMWSDWHPFGESDEDKAKAEAAKQEQAKHAAEDAQKKFDADESAKRTADESGKVERDKKREALPGEVQKDLEKENQDRSYEWAKKDPKTAGPAPEEKTLTAKQTERRIHGKMIGAEYSNPDQLPDKEPNKPIGSLETKADRMKFLEGFTQNDKNDPDSASYCGPTALIAATVYAQGSKGLSPMVGQWEAEAKKKADAGDADSKKKLEELGELQKKIDKGELTNKDMMFMQKTLYGQMQAFQAENKSGDKNNPAGITDGTMYAFLQRDDTAYLRRAFLEGGTRMSMVDNDGDDVRNHWVLEMGYGSESKNKVIFDPQTRKNGQIVRSSDQIEDYKKTNRYAYQENGVPYSDITPEKQDEIDRKNGLQ